jgi:hypothetical protein
MVQTKLPTYTKIPEPTQDYAGQSCATLIKSLASSMRKITDAGIKKNRKEAKSVEKDAEKKKSGGLWDTLMSGPLAAYTSKLQSLKDDSGFTAASESGLIQQMSNYMDLGIGYMDAAGNLVSNVVDTVVDEMNVINQLTESAGLGSLLPSGQAADCDKDLLVGMASSVFNVAAGAVSTGLSAVFSAQATIGMGFNAVGDMYAALLSLPAGYLSILVTNRKSMLESIQDRVNSTVEFAAGLTDKDYPFDHQTFILGLQKELEEADSELAQLGSILNAGGLFQDRLWESAQDTIEDASDELLGANADVKFRLSLIKLYGYQKFLETQVKLLNDRQLAFARLAANIGGFKGNIESTNLQNLTAPIISQVRCQIGQVMNDMTKTIETNALLKFIVNERRWGAELAKVYVMMSTMQGLARNLSKPSTAVNDAADALSDAFSVDATESITGGETYTRLVTLLNSFAKEVKRKIARNVDVEVLQKLAVSINREIEVLKISTSSIDKILNGFNSSIAAEGAEALTAVYSVVDMFGGQGLDSLVDAIYEGDIKKLFDINAITGMLEGVARKSIGDALQCCSQNAGDGDSASRLIHMNKILTDTQKAKAIYDRYTLSYAQSHLKELTTKSIPGWKRLQKDVTLISRAPCMNDGQPGGGVDLGLTII